MKVYVSLAAFFSFLGAVAFAEVLELEGTVKAVDASARSISVVRKTPKGEKVLDLEVAKKAGDLSKVKAGESIRLTYDPDVEVVTGFSISGGVTGTGNATEKKEDAISMIPKEGLKGWRLHTPLPEPNWILADGMLVCIGEGSDLATEADFDDFEMSVEFSLPSKCNSGIFLRDQYELQLLDNEFRDQKNQPARPGSACGAIWGKSPPKVNAYVGPNRWNKLYVRIVGDKVSARLNNKVILEDVVLANEQESLTALGPLRIQCTASTTGAKFRGWTVTPLSKE
jgi:hypothetical protein